MRPLTSLFLFHFILVVIGQGAQSFGREFFVAPDGRGDGTSIDSPASLESIRQRIRSVSRRMDADIVVNLRGGEYRLVQPWRLDILDSGYNGHRIVYRAYRDERPVIVGSVRLRDWVEESPGLVRTHVGRGPYHNLFVNGKRAVIARTPNVGTYGSLIEWDESRQEIVIPKLADVDWSKLHDFDLVTHRSWAGTYVQIEHFRRDGETVRLSPIDPWRTTLFTRAAPTKKPGQAFFLENARQFLDAPGEWFHDNRTGQLYYRLRPGETLANLAAELPTTERLLEVVGNTQDVVHDIIFEGIAFQFVAWNFRREFGGLLEGQTGWYYTGESKGAPFYFANTGAAVTAKFAERISFLGCSFLHLGGAGVLIENSTQGFEIADSLFYDVGGCGVLMGEPPSWQTKAWNPANPAEIPSHHLIRNNLFEQIGAEYVSSTAISAAYVQDVVIEHNEVRDAPYTGINVGSGWTAARNASARNIIRANRVHRVMRVVEDGAAIYTLSAQPGTVIEHNYIYDIERSATSHTAPVAGLYLDEGSSGIVMRENVIEMKNDPASRVVFVNLHKTGPNQIGDNGPTFDGPVEEIKTAAGLSPAVANELEARLTAAKKAAP